MEIGLGGILINKLESKSQKEYIRTIESHPVRMENCEVFTLVKNAIQTQQRKDIGSKTDIIVVNDPLPEIALGHEGIKRAANRYIEQNEDTGDFAQYLFKYKKNLIDGLNSFFIQKEIDLKVTHTRWTTINNHELSLSIKHGDIDSFEDLITSLWLLSIFYGKRTEPFTNCTINLPLNPYNFKKADLIIEKCNKLVMNNIRIKYQKLDNILHISISDIQLLELFKTRGNPRFDNITTFNYNGHLSKLFEGIKDFKLDFKDKTLKIVSTT